MQKKCTKCLKFLEFSAFSKNKLYLDGYCYWCRSCCNAHKRQLPKKKRVTTPETNRRKYQKYKEKYQLINKEYYHQHKDEIKAQQKQYRQKNKEFINLKNRKRQKLMNGKNISIKEINKLKELADNKCCYCGRSESLQMDHYVPLSKGGAHHISNIVIACKKCNLSKKDKLPEDWLKIINKA